MAVKQLGKKGMFLTFIAISLITALILIFTPSDITLTENIQAVKTRVLNVNEYVSDLENVYLERTLYAIGTKTIIAFIECMEAEEAFFDSLTDFETFFEEVLLYGTLGGVNIDDCYVGEIMTGNTYDDWIDKIIPEAKDAFNVDTVYGISDIRVYQITPWFVNVDADVSFNVSSETATWNKTVTIKTEIEIENFDDPYYLVNTGGIYSNKINKSNMELDEEWHIENVTNHIKHGTYVHWENSDAPSFLMRFYDDMSASDCCGIESLVNPDNVPSKDTVYVDYLYWSTPSDCAGQNLYTAYGIDSEVKFDSGHLSLYNRTVDAQQICP